MNSEFGILYLIPCPISDETAPWDVLPAANRAVMDALDYFIVENTRTARRFLSKAGIARSIGELEFRELNEHTAAGREIEELIAPLLEGELLTTDLKAEGHGVYLFAGKTPEQQTAAWERFTALARAGKVVSAWAVENGVAKGVSETAFAPDTSCTRAQIVTFLWRAQQSPASGGENPFADVPAAAYYYNAVLWAVENDVAKGVSETAFAPDDNCTRAQIVTLIYRCKK